MTSLHLILLVFSFVCAFLATMGVPSARFNLLAAAFMFYIASILF